LNPVELIFEDPSLETILFLIRNLAAERAALGLLYPTFFKGFETPLIILLAALSLLIRIYY